LFGLFVSEWLRVRLTLVYLRIRMPARATLLFVRERGRAAPASVVPVSLVVIMPIDVVKLKNTVASEAAPFEIQKLGHVVVRVSDLQRATDFYVKVLGLKVSDVYPEDMMPGGMVFLRFNADHHGVALVGGLNGGAAGRDLHHFAFEVASLDEVFRVRDHLRAQGVPIIFEGRRRAGVQIAVEFMDPDGHNLEIYWGIDRIGVDGAVRPANEWKGAVSLEEAIANPVRGQHPVLADPSLVLASPSREEPMTHSQGRRRVAVIGLGEAGGVFAKGLQASGIFEVVGYDALLKDPVAAPAVRDRIYLMGIAECSSFEQACRQAEIILSAVTANASRKVAEEASRYLKPEQFFFDINSVSPSAKRIGAETIEHSGAAYVEGAVMAPVGPSGIAVEILLAGARAEELAAILRPAGMNLEIVAATIGKASAIKMCRSIMIKGLEALVIECFVTARRFGIEDDIIDSLNRSFPGTDWEKRGAYMTGRVLQHGRRRAAELREVAATVAEAGLAPRMAPAAAAVQDWVAEVVAQLPELKSDRDWRAILDLLGGARQKLT
jgi:3-hydroxyisobutyrate dehydrogenase-like beta-hydroxyacid dehydrogenase/catechol 2,3-dioxygenase-like lactoylglutathione lyase family enzyme